MGSESLIASDRDIRDIFFAIENDPRVFSFRIRGISLYFILRFRLEMMVRNHYSNGGGSTKRSLISRLKKSMTGLLKTPGKTTASCPTAAPQCQPSPYLFISTSDWTIAPAESMELVEIIHYFRNKGTVINFVQPDYSGNVRKQYYHDSFIVVDTRKSRALESDGLNTLGALLKHLRTGLGIDPAKEKQSLAGYIAAVMAMAYQLRDVINSAGAKAVFARSVYTEPWIPIACWLTGANCLEVQHGVITPDNIYYQSSTPHNIGDGRLLFPDQIFTLGEEWRRILLQQRNTYGNESVDVLGAGTEIVRKTAGDGRTRVLVCLQPGIFSLDSFLLVFLEQYGGQLIENNVEVIIRPHPNNIAATYRLYEKLQNKNVLVQNSRDVKFYDELVNASLLFSASSMCLYEAVSVGIPAVSLQQFSTITIGDHLSYVKSPLDLFEKIVAVKQGLCQQNPINYFSPFRGESLERILRP